MKNLQEIIIELDAEIMNLISGDNYECPLISKVAIHRSTLAGALAEKAMCERRMVRSSAEIIAKKIIELDN